MSKKVKSMVILLNIFLLLLLNINEVFAGWIPFQFKGTEIYEYKVVYDMERLGKTDNPTFVLKMTSKDEKFYDMVFSVTLPVEKDKLSSEFMGKLSGTTKFFLEMIFSLPFMSMIFYEADLEEGKEYESFFGILKILNKVNIAGQEGYLCQFWGINEEENKEELNFEWVISPDLGLPLLMKSYFDGEATGYVELIKYEKY